MTRFFLDVRDQRTPLTQDLLIRLDSTLNITLDQAVQTWWYNIRPMGGMRLTSAGYAVFSKDLDLAQYSFDLEDPHVLTSMMLLTMDKKLQMPYYINARRSGTCKIILFGSSEALVATLYGDFKRWLDNYRT